MVSKKSLLLINQLQPGMISSIDINFENKILLAKGVVITESIINKLKQNYIIDRVEVFLDNDSSEPLKIKPKTVKELEKTFNEFSSNLKDIFNDISTLKNSEMSDVITFLQNIQQEFNSTGIVIKNIVCYGSGDDPIYRHSVNVAAISFILGKWLGITDTELNLLTYSAILHDFGKIQISEAILNKKDKLNPEEYETFKTHAALGYNFVKQIPYIDPSVSFAVLTHHERIDGSGYPLGIKADKISKFSKIIAIADLFDEISSNRYSNEIKGPFEALKIIQDQRLTKLDYNYCNMFLNHIVNYYMGENVLLNDKRCCKIIQIQMDDLTRPLVLDDNGFLDLRKEKDLHVQALVIS